MSEEIKHGLECSEFEALLSDAIDMDKDDAGKLSPAVKQSFDAHRRECKLCGPLFAEVQAGRQWLRSLEAVEPPANLAHNILAATSGVISSRRQTARGASRAPFGESAREWWDSYFSPAAAFVRQPRFVMSFGMIFFSLSLVLSLAGVKPKDVAKISLRPASIRHAYNEAQIKVVKYYDNIRFVYEIESKLRELKRTNIPAEPLPNEQKEDRKNNTSGEPDRGLPDQRQDRNYSQDYNQPVLAALRDAGAPITPVLRDGAGDAPPAVMVTTNRRFV